MPSAWITGIGAFSFPIKRLFLSNSKRTTIYWVGETCPKLVKVMDKFPLGLWHIGFSEASWHVRDIGLSSPLHMSTDERMAASALPTIGSGLGDTHKFQAHASHHRYSPTNPTHPFSHKPTQPATLRETGSDTDTFTHTDRHTSTSPCTLAFPGRAHPPHVKGSIHY